MKVGEVFCMTAHKSTNFYEKLFLWTNFFSSVIHIPMSYGFGNDDIEPMPKMAGPTKLIATTDMKIVAMIEFIGKIYLATEYGVFIHDPTQGEFDFREMEIVRLPPKEKK